MSAVHVRLREWQSLGPEHPQLEHVTLGGKEATHLAQRLKDAGVVEVTELRRGVQVQALAHVGRIQLGTLTITIEPKIGGSELLELLRYAYGLRNLRLFDQTEFAHTGELLQDLIAAQLLAEVTELVSRGLVSKYVARAEELASPRGRIDMNVLARRGPTTDGHLQCRHHVRSPDHLLNRTVRAGVALAAVAAQEPTLRRTLSRLSARLGSEIGEVRLGDEVLSRAKRELNRLTSAYEPAIRLTELIYSCAAVSLDGSATTPLPGFLFDMNRFFQTLMGRFLSDHLHGLEVHEERGLSEMMRYIPGMNPRGRRSPTPRPDFIVAKGRTVIALLDAKYRDLWERELPRDMLYQLAIYALSQPRPSKATILFPTASPDARDAMVEIRDPVQPTALGYVVLRPVLLSELATSITRSAGRERLARRFAFGSDTAALCTSSGMRIEDLVV